MSDSVDLEYQRGDLSIFAPEAWFSTPNESSVWVRVYTAVGIPHDDLEEAVASLVSGIPEGTLSIQDEKVLLATGDLEGLELPKGTQFVGSDESGTVAVRLEVDSMELPKDNYVLLSTPIESDGERRSEGEAKKVLDLLCGIIRLNTGVNFLRDLVLEGEVGASDGELTVFPGGSVRVPKPAEGPFLSPECGVGISEIADALDRARQERWDRVSLALEYVQEGMRKDHGFFEYWTALEVLCGSKDASGSIPSRLAKCYDSNVHEIREKTAYKRLETWRHDFVKKGERPPMTADVERYIQMLILDVLRYELNLSHENHLAAYEYSQGVDLTPLGFSDDRLEAQKSEGVRDEAGEGRSR